MRSRALAGLLPLLALAACGSGGTAGSAGPTVSTAPTSPTSPTSSTGSSTGVPTSPAGGVSTSPTYPSPSSVSPTGPPATIQVRLVALDNQTRPCQGSSWCAKLGYTQALQHTYDTTTCHAGDTHPNPDPRRAVVACSNLGEKYLLGPAKLTNQDVARAAAALSDTETWAVNIDFTASGSQTFLALTKELTANDQQYAIMVDGSVVAAPSVFQASRSAQLTGSDQGFTQNAAEQLAARINEGAGAS